MNKTGLIEREEMVCAGLSDEEKKNNVPKKLQTYLPNSKVVNVEKLDPFLTLSGHTENIEDL